MHITTHISAALVLGSVLVSPAIAGDGEGGDGRVELIEFPGDSTQAGAMLFSGDGSTIMVQKLEGEDSVLQRYREGRWELLAREAEPLDIPQMPWGMSEDGSVSVVGNYSNARIVEGMVSTYPPTCWTSSRVLGHACGYVGQGTVSGDGAVYSFRGVVSDSHVGDALLWDGEGDFENLSDDIDIEGADFSESRLSEDGSVGAFSARFSAPINNIRGLNTDRDVWVWQGHEAMRIEHLDPGYEVVMRLSAVSGNGEAVIGRAEGIWHPEFNGPPFGSDAGVNTLVHGPDLAWIWTQAGGTQQITDPRFSEMSPWDIDHDATIVYGTGARTDGRYQRFLWLRDGRTIPLDDLFYSLGISIEADWYSFNQISADGTRLMGLALVEGHYHALIVTIPDLTP